MIHEQCFIHRKRVIWLPRKLRRSWLRCRHCGRRLGQVDVVHGWTCVRIGTVGGVILHGPVVCAGCGTKRVFESVFVGED
jgi:RNase P subunit RPR2